MKTINDFNVKQIWVSKSLKQFQYRIKKKYNLIDCDLSSKEPSFFFGIYVKNDVNIIENYNGKVFLICGGSDLHMVLNLKKRKNIHLLFISDNLVDRYNYFVKRYNKYRFIYTKINFNLVDTSIFKPVNIKELGKSIYVYDGYDKEKKYNKDKRVIIYNIDLINKVKNKLPQFNFIHSSDKLYKYEEMPNVYKQCFIGLRLTPADGNANTVQEFEAMNIPIIHNHSSYGIKWQNEHDVVKIIKLHYNYFLKNVW